MSPAPLAASPGAIALYLLDTDVLIDVCKGREPAATRVQALAGPASFLCSCAITIAEYYSGEAKGSFSWRDGFIASLHYLDSPPLVAEAAGKFRQTFASRGIALSTQDVLVAATAAYHGAVVVTRNIKDFPMDGVRVMSVTGA